MVSLSPLRACRPCGSLSMTGWMGSITEPVGQCCRMTCRTRPWTPCAPAPRTPARPRARNASPTAYRTPASLWSFRACGPCVGSHRMPAWNGGPTPLAHPRRGARRMPRTSSILPTLRRPGERRWSRCRTWPAGESTSRASRWCDCVIQRLQPGGWPTVQAASGRATRSRGLRMLHGLPAP